MICRALVPLMVITLGMATPLSGQRPIVGLGLGGGVVLGTRLLDYSVEIPVDGQSSTVAREINLNQIGILDAHVEIYPIPHIALRGHGMWGRGDLRVQTRVGGRSEELNVAPGRVQISGLDAGISLWPWAPTSIGFAPFVTLGLGRVIYDFDATDDGEYFHATGRRKENAFLFGVGADLNVWRSITLRVEAMNHRLDSPLEVGDFVPGLVPQSALDQRISNVSLVVDLHLYLPFRTQAGGSN